MKVIVQIICKDKDEFDRGEQMICNILESIQHGDFITADMVIGSKEEGNAHAEK